MQPCTYTHLHTCARRTEIRGTKSPLWVTNLQKWSGREVPVQYGKQQTSLVTAWPIKLSSAKGLQPEPVADALPVDTLTELWPLTPRPLLVGPDLQTQEEEGESFMWDLFLVRDLSKPDSCLQPHCCCQGELLWKKAKSCTFSRPLYVLLSLSSLLSVSSLVFTCSCSVLFAFSTFPQSLVAAVSFPASPRAEKEKQFLPSPVWACTAGKQTQLPCSLRAGAS